ncbi:YceI family protein [Aquimarina muelleri]|uniref:YceI family protein n=1 Tax=Aquimarina muelleri TaxID=279356 RepID=UPI003F686725
MKIFIYIVISMFLIEGVAQNILTNELAPNPKLDYTLINDFKRLEFDKEKSRISFDCKEGNTSGTISGLDFKIKFNPKDPENSSFSGTALVKTLDTDNFLRDGHLMWEKFFYKKKSPKILFKSTHVVSFGKNTYKVIGNLTIKGIEKEIIITFSLDDKKLLGVTTIYTNDFGIHIHEKREQNKLDIRFYFPILP